MSGEILLGDVVRLKSGGPSMTVEDIDDEGRAANCSWFDGDHKHQSRQFKLTSLRKIDDYGPLPFDIG